MKFSPYPRYKESGFECYGQVPSNWRVERIDRLFSQRREEPLPEDKLVSAFITGEVTLRDNKTDNIIKSSGYEIGYKRIRKGDLVISGMNAHLGGLGISDSDGKGSPVNLVLKPVVDLERQFFSYLLRHLAKSQFIKSLVNTIRFNSSDFKSHDLKSIFVLVPPIEEQKNIAEFLDVETLRIDELIAKQERLIALLQEKRQAKISNVVIKGLNPNVLMKQSGIEWLGEIPAHWEIKRLSRLTPDDRQIMYGIILPGPSVDDGVPIVKGGDVSPSRLRLQLLNRTTREIESGYSKSRLKGGDLVYAIRGSIGLVEIVPDELTGANLTQDAARISPKRDVNNRWLLYALKAGPVFSQLDAVAVGASVKGINIRDLKRALVPLPPKDEQDEIAKNLHQETIKIDALIEKARRAVTLLNEHRTALISAAVTGKIDVRQCRNGNLSDH